MKDENEKLRLFLLGNGDMSAWTSQETYELAWSNGIRPLNEAGLKPKRDRKGRAC